MTKTITDILEKYPIPIDMLDDEAIEGLNAAIIEILDSKQRFIMPTDADLIRGAILFNDGKLNQKTLTNMVAYAEWVLARLHENGDILIPAKFETQNEKPHTGKLDSNPHSFRQPKMD